MNIPSTIRPLPVTLANRLARAVPRVVLLLIAATLLSAATGGPVMAQTVSWTQRTADGAVGSPAARNNHAMAYDATRGVTVLFGGAPSSGGLTNDTWEWNGTTWTMTTANGAVGSPPAR
ncbi:MAG: hypothetical protein HY303_12305, partial [Candidatus Wallbacteria bacterium]|nr:hypothetical protein [Candidatus Wallbacteria bacterium]